MGPSCIVDYALTSQCPVLTSQMLSIELIGISRIGNESLIKAATCIFIQGLHLDLNSVLKQRNVPDYLRGVYQIGQILFDEMLVKSN